MKTENFWMKSIAVVALTALLVTGCKKKDDEVTPDTTPSTEETTKQQTNANDQANVDQQMNESMDDANKVLSDNSNTRKDLPCNVTIDSSALMTQGLIKLTYGGPNCDGTKTRTGEISLQLPFDKSINKPVRWSAKGAYVQLTYKNFKVTRIADGKSLTFNGQVTATNVTGGGVFDVLVLKQTVTHNFRGGLTLTFDDNTTREWAVARSRSYKPSLTVLVVEDAGDTVINGKTISYWGKNRANEEFSISIDQPVATEIITATVCRLYKPYQGVVTINTTATSAAVKTATITYGVDATGTQVLGNACPFGYRLNWTDPTGGAQQLIIKY